MERSPRVISLSGRTMKGQVMSLRPEYLLHLGRPLVLFIAVVITVDELAEIKFQVCLAGEGRTLIRERERWLAWKAEYCNWKTGDSNRKCSPYKSKPIFVEGNLQVALVSSRTTYCYERDGLLLKKLHLTYAYYSERQCLNNPHKPWKWDSFQDPEFWLSIWTLC